VQRSIREYRARENLRRKHDLLEQLLLAAMRENEHLVAVREINLAVGPQRGRANFGLRIVAPQEVPGFRLEAVEVAIDIGHVEQPILGNSVADGAAEANIVVGLGVRFQPAVAPHDRRIRIWFAFAGLLLQYEADVAIPRRIDGVEVAVAAE